MTEFQKSRIKALTEGEEDLSAPVIAERLGLSVPQVHYHQARIGLRKPKEREDKEWRKK